jgi:NAD-dependent dihydropyrimidine dehydrogenase PreA subunit
MQLAPVALKDQGFMPNRGDCLKCSLCVGTCPTGALTFQETRPDKKAA